MEIIKIKYGILNDVIIVSYYFMGELELYKVEGESVLDILGYKFIFLYGFIDERCKEFL